MTPPETPQPLSEETLKELEELLGNATPGEWWNESEVIHCNVKENGYPHVCSISENNDRQYSDADLICYLRNHAAELIRGYRLGIGHSDKDRKP